MAKKNELSEANNTAKAAEVVEQPTAVPEETAGSAGTAAVQPAAEMETKPELAEAKGDNESGFYIYLGPNIKGLIQTGTIYRGDRVNACQKAAAAIEKQPLVKTLIVSGDALAQARLRVKTPGNALYANYQKLAGK